jgi:steroid delta-isomerase-like uncharacterized protein
MPSKSTPQLDNKQIVHKHIDDCFNQGKLNMVADAIAANCRFHDPVFPSQAPGVESAQKHIGMIRSAFPDLKYTIDDTIAERNEVVIHWTVKGTHKAPFLGIPATNRKASVVGTSIYKLEGSKIVEIWSNWNLMSLMEQLGITAPAKAETKAHA